jgi:glycosyltransferase involved in cell wall biosynthesis
MKKNPRISIVTACYNSLKFINCLHESLCHQDFKDFEWILVDDCSSDDTVKVLKKLSSPGDGGVSLYKLPENSGGGVAICLAIKKAIGDIVLIIDHDDELVPEALTSIINSWNLVTEDSNLCGIFFARLDAKTRSNIGGSLERGTKFSTSWLSNSKPGITDGVFALKSQIAKKYFNMGVGEWLCLAGVPFTNMTKVNKLVAAGGAGIVIYHRDNPDSQTNSVKISRKTVYTYAKYIDLFDKYYLLRPFYWIRHLIALIKFSIAVHKNPFYHYKYINSWIIIMASFILTPAGVIRYIFSKKNIVIYFTEFCFSDLDDLPNLKCKP